jgi:hypothetical protein
LAEGRRWSLPVAVTSEHGIVVQGQLDFLVQRFRRARFLQDIRDTSFFRLIAELLGKITRQEDDRNRGVSCRQQVIQLKAIRAGQAKVHNQNSRLRSIKGVEKQIGRIKRFNDVSKRTDQEFQRLPDVGIIFDDKNNWFHDTTLDHSLLGFGQASTVHAYFASDGHRPQVGRGGHEIQALRRSRVTLVELGRQ